MRTATGCTRGAICARNGGGGDTKTNHIVRIAVEFGPPPNPPPPNARFNRGRMLLDSFRILAVGK